MKMKFGLALPYNQTSHIAAWARTAEDQGWDGLFAGDAVWCEDPMIGLAAAAVATNRIRLGTMIVPAPLLQPWKIASMASALDQLSGGRMILGLGTGATWMGWQGFPGVEVDHHKRVKMLEETIEIITGLFKRKPFDYFGDHYQLKLTVLDEIYYTPRPVQRPRIPLWIPAKWPGERSMQRALKCDGVFVEKWDPDGEANMVRAEDIFAIRNYVRKHRSVDKTFDVVVEGSTTGLDRAQREDKFSELSEAGASWWIEGLWDQDPESVNQFLQETSPGIS